MSDKKSYRITNTTAATAFPGYFLDYNGSFIPPNHFAIVTVDAIPAKLEEWATKGMIQIVDAATGNPASISPAAAQDIPRPMFREASAERDDFDMDELDDFDPSEAKEASIPEDAVTGARGGHMPPTDQAQSKARVSLGQSSEPVKADQISPIPGDKPRSIDDSDKFTVRAPKQSHVGGIAR